MNICVICVRYFLFGSGLSRLGYMKDFQYGKQKITMHTGDTLFLYTDGVDEAMDINENEFSEKRLKATLKQFTQTNSADLNKSVIGKVQEFTGNIPQSDDITLLTLRYAP